MESLVALGQEAAELGVGQGAAVGEDLVALFQHIERNQRSEDVDHLDLIRTTLAEEVVDLEGLLGLARHGDAHNVGAQHRIVGHVALYLGYCGSVAALRSRHTRLGLDDYQSVAYVLEEVEISGIGAAVLLRQEAEVLGDAVLLDEGLRAVKGAEQVLSGALGHTPILALRRKPAPELDSNDIHQEGRIDPHLWTTDWRGYPQTRVNFRF